MKHYKIINELEDYTLEGLKDLQRHIARLIQEAERAEAAKEEAAEEKENAL